jgi:hypothetical protein
MPKQFLNYTDLTFNEIVSQVNDRLKEDPEKRFDSFLESSVAQTMIDIFAASTDMTNYYIERRAEEQFLDTARLKSSVIQLSKILGYVIQRAVPAESSAKIIMKGPLPPDVDIGHTVTFKAFETSFSFGDKKFVLKKDYQYKFTADDISQGSSKTFRKEITVSVPNGGPLLLNQAGLVPTSATSPIEIMQGEIKTKTIIGASNTQVGNIFQKYLIDDKTFSNVFGSEDLNYDVNTDSPSLLADGLTKIAIAPASVDITTAFGNENMMYEIDRRSILTSETVINQRATSNTTPNVCSIRTTTNQGVEILFGDSKIASKGVENGNQNLYIQYFSTKGLGGNETGVLNKKLTTSNTFETSFGTQVSLNFDWQFNSNITVGADLESIDSIKLNAPGLFYSLDRLITSKDYITYLKSLTTPVNIKNALAWGEQEELVRYPLKSAIPAFFNLVFYSCIGPLYNIGKTTGTHTHKDVLSSNASDDDKISTFIEGVEYDIGGTSFADQNYFNIYIKQDVTKVLHNIEVSTAPGVSIVNNKIRKRSQLTLRNAYMTPLIQQFEITGDVYVKSLVSINEIERRVNNAIYEFLNEQSDFATPLYLSNITELIESFPEVINTTPTFTPVSGTGMTISNLASDPNISNTNWTPTEQTTIIKQFQESFKKFAKTIAPSINGNLNKQTVENAVSNDFDISIWNELSASNPPFTLDGTASLPLVYVSEIVSHLRVAGLTERNFYENFMRHFYTELDIPARQFLDSNDFKELFGRANQQLKPILRSAMKDSHGNIVNYGFQHEIVQAMSKLNFKYRG